MKTPSVGEDVNLLTRKGKYICDMDNAIIIKGDMTLTVQTDLQERSSPVFVLFKWLVSLS